MLSFSSAVVAKPIANGSGPLSVAGPSIREPGRIDPLTVFSTPTPDSDSQRVATGRVRAVKEARPSKKLVPMKTIGERSVLQWLFRRSHSLNLRHRRTCDITALQGHGAPGGYAIVTKEETRPVAIGCRNPCFPVSASCRIRAVFEEAQGLAAR